MPETKTTNHVCRELEAKVLCDQFFYAVWSGEYETASRARSQLRQLGWNLTKVVPGAERASRRKNKT